MIKTLSITEARNKFPTLINDAKNKLDEYVITVNGKPAAILISHDEYESMQETLEILSDKKLMKELKEAEEDVKAGRVKDWEEVKKELGWNV